MAETLVTGRGYPMKAMLPEPLIVKVGRHTPQHCSVLSRRKRRRAAQDILSHR
jgi:hypothetical protein